MTKSGTMGFNSGASLSASDPKRGRGLFRAAAVALVLVALGLLVYWNFIFGGNTLLYKDIGSDSVNISYPYYVLLSDYLRHVGIPSWSFHVGMGQSLFPYLGTVLITPVVWLAKGAIAKALVYQHLLYVVISGLLFARFLADRGLTFVSCLLGAILLSFSAYMCMGSCWYFHANEVVCFTFLLFAAEQAVSRGRWLYLVLAVAVVGVLSAFYLYICALLLVSYVPLRLIERYSFQPLPIFRTCISLGAAATLGVGISAIITVSNLYALLNSPRGSGTTSVAAVLSSFPVFGLESPLHYITVCLRPFANDMLGTGSQFRGWQNYLEAPMSYCGLLCLILLPQIFVTAIRRERILYAFLLSGIAIPIVFPWFRYLFWLFQGDYYRVFSLFVIFAIITLSMTALSRYIKGQRLSLTVLGATILVLLGTLYFPLDIWPKIINSGLRREATILLILYAAALVAGQTLKRPRMAALIILLLTAIELFRFDRITVADRPTVTKQELIERVGYNDEAVDAVRDINVSDNSFFRITKTWSSGPSIYTSLNDALVFGYYGTSSYSSFNNLNYINFLIAVDAIPAGSLASKTQWSLGLLGHTWLSTFACEKYVLTDNPVPFQMGEQYEFVRNYVRSYLFRNQQFLPFGLTFSHCLSEDIFLQLPSSMKSEALFYAAVLSNKNAPNQQGFSLLTLDELRQQMSESSLRDIIARRRASALSIRSFNQTRIYGTVRLEEKSILVLQTPFDPGWRAYQDGRDARVLKVDGGLLGVTLEKGEHEVKLRYRPPFVVEGAAVTLVSLAIFGASLWRWPRVLLPV